MTPAHKEDITNRMTVSDFPKNIRTDYYGHGQEYGIL